MVAVLEDPPEAAAKGKDAVATLGVKCRGAEDASAGEGSPLEGAGGLGGGC